MNWPRICTSAVAVTMFILSSERATCAEPAAGDLPAMLKAKGYTAVPLKIMKNGHLDVDVKVKGETLRFILDTGAGSTVIDVVVAKRLGFQVVKTDKTHAGVTGSAMLEKTTIDQLSVGPVQSREEAVVADLSAVNGERKKDGDPPCDGLLGAGILQLFGAVIDYPSAQLFLMDPHAAAMAIYDGRAIPKSEATVNRSFGGGRFTYAIIVRLATDQPMLLNKTAFEKVESGMTYSQVAEILGGELSKGQLTKNYSGAFAVVHGKSRIDLTFQAGKVSAKASQGLE